MRLLFPNRFIPLLLATAVALAAFTSVPAYADDRRAARTIATILGLAVVGKIIHDKRKDEKKAKKAKKEAKERSYKDVQRRHYDPQPARRPAPLVHRHGNLTHAHRDGEYVHNHGYTRHQPRPLPQAIDRKLLPKQCFQNIQTRDGSAQLFERRCLERSYSFVDNMPQSCAQRIRTRDGTLSGYDARCLRRNGYSLARS
ncbi:hypothetical protein ABMC89_12610 [Sulfitobacter sp. HNIBRBA3233]|uniref:hypothetical protein n=1 Tax=Sulfitobacter marinivivus TaxID=3158558 RepID=UPI0032DECCD0